VLWWLAPLVQIAAIVALFWNGREWQRRWRCGLRREWMLAQLLSEQGQILQRLFQGEPVPFEDAERLGLVAEVALADELGAQAKLRWWHRIPRVGQPWPDSMLGDALPDEQLRL